MDVGRVGRGLPGVQVDTVNVELRDDGTNRRARLGLTYQAGTGLPPSSSRPPTPRTRR